MTVIYTIPGANITPVYPIHAVLENAVKTLNRRPNGSGPASDEEITSALEGAIQATGRTLSADDYAWAIGAFVAQH